MTSRHRSRLRRGPQTSQILPRSWAPPVGRPETSTPTIDAAALIFFLMLGAVAAVAKSDRRAVPVSSVLGMRRVVDHAARPIQCPCVAVWPSRFQNCGVLYSACTGCPAPPASTSSVLGRLVMLNACCGAAQIRSPARADLVGPVVQRTEATRAARRVIVRPSADSVGTSCRVISAPCPGGLGPMSCPTPVLAAAVGDQRHTEHQVLVHRSAPVADIAGDIAGDHRALREADQHVAGQRAPVVHVGERLDRGPGALGAAVVVGHLLVRRRTDCGTARCRARCRPARGRCRTAPAAAG